MSIWQVGRDTGGDFKSGVEAVIAAALQMPEFLYRFELSPAAAGKKLIPLDGYDMATRLSYLLWNSGPDDALLAAAQANKLQTAADISAQVMRMLSQPRPRRWSCVFTTSGCSCPGLELGEDPRCFPCFRRGRHRHAARGRALVDALVFQAMARSRGCSPRPIRS